MQLDKITSIRLYSGDNAELQKIADLKGLDRADIIRAAVKSYIQDYKSQLMSQLGTAFGLVKDNLREARKIFKI